jgi:chorismate mutase
MTREQAFEYLNQCRERIDEIDVRILSLINERTVVVEEIGRIKRAAGLPIYEPRREDQVFQNVTENNRGPLSAGAVHRVFERIIDEMRGIQRERMLEENRAEPSEGN